MKRGLAISLFCENTKSHRTPGGQVKGLQNDQQGLMSRVFSNLTTNYYEKSLLNSTCILRLFL